MTAAYLENGDPRYVRVYAGGEDVADRFTVVFSRLGHKAGMRGLCLYLGMSAQPFHPQGFCQHGEHTSPIDRPRYSHLGKKISFRDLPSDCQKAVLQDYMEYWPKKQVA